MPGFLTSGGHGKLAGPVKAGERSFGVAPSCATCHAREFCITCHVDAPEQQIIQALASDPRSLVHRAKLEAPSDHGATGFQTRHGASAQRSTAERP